MAGDLPDLTTIIPATPYTRCYYNSTRTTTAAPGIKTLAAITRAVSSAARNLHIKRKGEGSTDRSVFVIGL